MLQKFECRKQQETKNYANLIILNLEFTKQRLNKPERVQTSKPRVNAIIIITMYVTGKKAITHFIGIFS